MEAHQSVGVTIKICLMCWCAADANCEEFRAEAPPWLMEAVSFPIDIRLRQRGGGKNQPNFQRTLPTVSRRE